MGSDSAPGSSSDSQSGAANLDVKILFCSGKICLIVSAVFHIIFSLLIFGIIGYVYSKNSESYSLFLLAPATMALISSIGAILFVLKIKEKLHFLIGIIWPILLFIVTIAMSIISLYKFVGYNADNVENYGFKDSGILSEVVNIFFMSFCIFLLPVSFHCAFILFWIGCCNNKDKDKEKDVEKVEKIEKTGSGDDWKTKSKSKSPVSKEAEKKESGSGSK